MCGNWLSPLGTKVWYIEEAIVDLAAIEERDVTFEIRTKSVLKNGYRALCLQDSSVIRNAAWYKEFLQRRNPKFLIDGSGVYRLVNLDVAEGELYFERANIPIGFQPTIFYSWQSDFNASRSSIREELERIVEQVNGMNPIQQLQPLLQPTRDGDGAVDLEGSIKANIERSILAVFDVTNIALVNPALNRGAGGGGEEVQDAGELQKAIPNPNVMFELSYALARKDPRQIIIVKQTRKDFGDDAAPFDIRQIRTIKGANPASLKQLVGNAVLVALRQLRFLPE